MILWCLFGTLITQIWACYMRGPGDYNGFMASKFFIGFFAQAGSPNPICHIHADTDS